MLTLLGKFATDTRGATAIEYGMIAGLLSIVIATAAATAGTNLSSLYDSVATAVTGAAAN